MNQFLMDFIRTERLNRKMKQSDLAEMVGVRNSSISNYENGTSTPDIDTLIKICGVFGYDFREILGEAYGTNVPGTDFSIKPSEISILKDIRSLDDEGRAHIIAVIRHELGRLREIEEAKSDSIFVPIAAHEMKTPLEKSSTLADDVAEIVKKSKK